MSFLKDDTGALSSTRLAFLLWMIGILVMWIYVCINQKTLVALDPTLIGVMGVFMTGKVIQSKVESEPTDVK